MRRCDRRTFLGGAAMTMAAAGFGVADALQGGSREPREWAAIGRATQWINSPPLTAASVAGKVVLVQFCTYTCINWLRTLPYIRAWAQKYRQGLVVIGVHTPEFEFEKNLDNVTEAMQQMRIEYPIVIDNDYSIWRAFRNQYWPALYLFDTRGSIRHRHFGEGEYQQSELAVQRLLPDPKITDGFVTVAGTGAEAAADWSNLRTAETYLRNGWTGSSPSQRSNWSFAGPWTIGRHAARLIKPPGRIIYRFHARDLHLVMGPSRPDGRIRFRVTLDNQPPGTAHGVDVDQAGHGTVIGPRMYQLIRQTGSIVERRFEIEFLDAGVESYAFTFG
jgi:thiol-disulfide isomerase/thioredoxin